MEKRKVVIIGAGPAGLTAGYELLYNTHNEYEVVILESEKQVGGISKTINYNGNRMDIGGHRFFSKNDDIMNFWKEIMPLQGMPAYDDEILKKEKEFSFNGPNPKEENNVMLIRERISRIFYLKKFFDYPVSLKWKTLKNMGLIKTIKVGFSYLKTLIIKKKEISLENFYINRFGKELYSMFFEKYTEKLWGRHPSEISSDWGAQRVKGLSILVVLKDVFNKVFKLKSKKNTETSLIEQFWYPKFGPGQLWEKVAEKVEEKGGIIKKGFEVTKINVQNSKIISVECNNNGEKIIIEGDLFISSMPIKDLVNCINEEKQNSDILRIANGLPYRDFMTVGVLVSKLNIKNETKLKTLNNIVPDCWIYVQEPNVKLR